MTTLDYIDAIVMSFVSMLVFTVWVGKRLDSAFVLHGVLIGAFGIGGIAGGLIAERRHRRAAAAIAGGASAPR